MNRKSVLIAGAFTAFLVLFFAVIAYAGEPPVVGTCQSVAEIEIPALSPTASSTLQAALNVINPARMDNDTYCLKFNIYRMQDEERVPEILTVGNTISLDINLFFNSAKIHPNRVFVKGLKLRANDALAITDPVLKIIGVGNYTKVIDMEEIELSNVRNGFLISAGARIKVVDSAISCPEVAADEDKVGTGAILRSKHITFQGIDISGCNIGAQIEKTAQDTVIGALSAEDISGNMNVFRGNDIGIKWTDGDLSGAISTAKFAFNSFVDNSVAPIDIEGSVALRLGIDVLTILDTIADSEAAPGEVLNALNCARDDNNMITSRWINVAGVDPFDVVAAYRYDRGGAITVPQPQDYLTTCVPDPEGRCYLNWTGSSDAECGEEGLSVVFLAYDSRNGNTTESTAVYKLYDDGQLAVGPVLTGGDLPTTSGLTGVGPDAGPVVISSPEPARPTVEEPAFDSPLSPQNVEETEGGKNQATNSGGPDDIKAAGLEAAIAASGSCGKGTIAPSSSEKLTATLMLLWCVSLPIPVLTLARKRMKRK